MDFPVGEFDQIGNLAAHIEGRVEFDRTLRRAELRPGKKTETEVDRRGVDGTEFVLERELPLRGKYLALLKHRIEEGFVDRRRTMLVGVGDRGTEVSPRWYHMLSRERSPVSIPRRESFPVAWA